MSNVDTQQKKKKKQVDIKKQSHKHSDTHICKHLTNFENVLFYHKRDISLRRYVHTCVYIGNIAIVVYDTKLYEVKRVREIVMKEKKKKDRQANRRSYTNCCSKKKKNKIKPTKMYF